MVDLKQNRRAAAEEEARGPKIPVAAPVPVAAEKEAALERKSPSVEVSPHAYQCESHLAPSNDYIRCHRHHVSC